MRAEEKEVDGAELERAQRLTESELEKGDDEELPEVVADEERDLQREERGGLLEAMRAILARQHVVVDELQLPAHELRALEALKAAVDGRDPKLAMFVYASDRRSLLEQALTVLESNVSYSDAVYAQIVERVGALRRDLTNLEDSQDELLDGAQKEALEKTGGPPKPKPPPVEVDPDAPKPPSTLSGPEVKEPPKPATTLGDAAEIAAAQADAIPQTHVKADEPKAEAKKPWWKRPFG